MPLSPPTLIRAIETSNLAHTITGVDGDMPIVYANTAFFNLTGYGHNEVIGRNCRFLQGPKTEPDAVDRIRWALANQEPVELNLTNYRRDGSSFVNHLHLAPVHHETTGEPVAFIGIQADVSRLFRQFRFEQEHRNLTLLGRYGTRINQEIRKALQPAWLIGETLRNWRSLPARDLDTSVDTLRSSLTAALDLSSDINTLTTSSPIKPPPVAVAILALEVRHRVRSLMPTGIGLTVEAQRIAGEAAAISIKPRHFIQVVSNLVTSALSTTGGAGALKLRWDMEVLCLAEGLALGVIPGNYLRLDIISGMDGEIPSQTPEAWFTAVRNIDEAGFDLSLSQSLVAEVGGVITVQNCDQRHIIFSLHLPAVSTV